MGVQEANKGVLKVKKGKLGFKHGQGTFGLSLIRSWPFD